MGRRTRHSALGTQHRTRHSAPGTRHFMSHHSRIVCLTEETTETRTCSAIILQPGPAALTDGVRQMHEHIARASRS